MARDVRIGIMAKPPKKVTSRLSKDVRDVLREMSQHPTGMPRKIAKSPQLTAAEAEAAKQAAKKVQPLTIKQWGKKLTPAEIEKAAKIISKERGISVAKAKEQLWKELKNPPLTKPTVSAPTFISKKIPTRQEFESMGYRAVKYKGQTVWLSPGQLKNIDKGTSGPIPRTQYEQITNITPERRKIIDQQAAKQELQLRLEAIRDWENQQKASKINKEVRPPAEAAKGASPVSSKAENYAERLYQKSFKTLTPNERKKIQMIIEEEARRAQRATSSVVGKNVKRNSFTPTGGLPGGVIGFGGGGIIDQIK